MKIISADRGQGKTTKLVEISSKKWKYIVCKDKQRVDVIIKTAERLGLDIPYPITIRHLPISQFSRIKSVLIDDIEDVIQCVIGRRVDYATTSCKIERMKKRRRDKVATVTKIFCDRCGKEIKHIGWTSKLLNIFKSKLNNQIKIRKIYNGNHSGFGYTETNYELCAECKDLGYKWDSGAMQWYRKIGPITGSAPDRAAELGKIIATEEISCRCPNDNEDERLCVKVIAREPDRFDPMEGN